MKKFLALMFLTGIVANVLAQESETRNIGSFTGVKVSQGIDVYLTKGSKESVKVEVVGTSLSNVLTDVSGSYLKVRMKDGNYHGRVDAKVYVTYTKIEKLSASSAGSIYTQGVLESSNLEISSASAGNVEVEVTSESISASASSAGEIEIKGKTANFSADVSSAGEIDAYDLESKSVSVESSSAGSAKVNVADALVANASSGGSIRYRGNPSKSITNSSSGGSVKKSN